jgi:Sigma-70 region 2.
LDEKQLLLKAQEGDIESFENVISNYQNYIYNVIYRLVDVKEDALDLTQETLIKAYINLKNSKATVNLRHGFIELLSMFHLILLERKKVLRNIWKK